MMTFTPSQITLLQILGDGMCHSGNELGKALGVTRSAIWKHINQLIAWGVPINRLAKQGYQLPRELILLNQTKITAGLLANNFAKPLQLHLFSSIDSTNRYLKELPPSPFLVMCCSERQTQGRGRFGRHWHSPFGENIYCSSRWSFNCDLARLSGLSLITSLAVLATINDITTSSAIKIKWPNDILWNGKKLCGSLIEILAESNGNAQIIIGIGINVNSDTKLLDNPWCSLYEICGLYFDRNILIAKLINNLNNYLDKFITHHLRFFMNEWKQYDYLMGQYCTVTQSGNTISGIAQGINEAGQLILKDEQGIMHYLSSGDTTLKTN